MKNLKKVAALVIVLAMALSSVAFAGYTDVAEDASYAEAVEVMSALGLLKGYEDGTFGPDKTITRAEFAAVIVRALGMEDAAAGAVANTIFEDVTSAHWAAGYVQIANQQGIISGYGDGKFGPDDEVTYEQAVKMIVCALGYGIKFAGVENAYPSAYLSQANTSGITVGATGKIGEKATRAIVAKLVYNALDVKLMEQTGFGTDTKFEEVNKTLLSSRLNVAKFEAAVNALHFDPELIDEVNITLSKADAIYCAAMECNVNPSTGAYILSSLNGDYKFAETVSPVDIKGYSCVTYVDVSGDEEDWTIVAMVPKAGKNSTLVLTATQTEGATIEVTNATGKEATYFKNSVDTDVNDTKIKLSNYDATAGTGDVAVYVNKNAAALAGTALASFETAWGNGTYAQFTLIDNNGDSKYDVIYATDYTAGIVDEIAARSYKLTFSNSVSALRLDPESETYVYSLMDADGKALEFADIKVGDVVNFMTSVDGSYTYYDVIVTSNKVEGSVAEVLDTVRVGSRDYATEVKIGDVDYLVDDYTLDLKSGNSGVFVVDMLGKILDFEIAEGNTNFGYIYGSYADTTGFDPELKTIILTTAGEFVTFDYAKNIYLNTTTASTAVSSIVSSIPAALTTKGLAMYETNSSNQITKVFTGANIAANSKYTAKTAAAADFKASTEVLDGDYITDATIFMTNEKTGAEMAVGGFVDEKSNYGIGSKALFNEDDTYEIATIIDRDDNIVLALVYGAKAKVDNASAPMYVTKVGTTVDAEGNDAKTVTGYVDGELVSIVVTDNTNIYSRKYISGYTAGVATYADVYTGLNKNSISQGAMIQYAGEGEVSAVRVLVSAADVIAGTLTRGNTAIAEIDNDDEGFVYAGPVYEIIRNKNICFGTTATPVAEVDFSAGVEAALVKLNGSAIRNVFGGYAFNDVETGKDPYGTNNANDDILVVYKFDGEAVGAIVIDGAADFE